MPARSNAFQSLVRDIERQLQAPAAVTESAMLPDRDGTLREVDILVETKAGVHPLLLAIECRDHVRKADVIWIEQLGMKYQELPQVSQVVAVSRAGFAKRALVKARSLGIRPMTLGQASGSDWSAFMRRITKIVVEVMQYRLAHVSLTGITEIEHEARDLDPDRHELLRPDGTRVPLRPQMRALTSESDIRRRIDEAVERGDARPAITFAMLGWSLAGDTFNYPLKSVLVEFVRPVNKAEIPIQHADYGDAAVAFGGAKSGDMEFSVVTTRTKGEKGPQRVHVHIDGGASKKAAKP